MTTRLICVGALAAGLLSGCGIQVARRSRRAHLRGKRSGSFGRQVVLDRPLVPVHFQGAKGRVRRLPQGGSSRRRGRARAVQSTTPKAE